MVEYGVDRAACKASSERDRDRKVHVQRSRTQCRPRASEEDTTWPDKRGYDDEETDPAKEALELRIHPVYTTAVKRDRCKHDVDRNGARDPDAHQHRAVFALSHRIPHDTTKRMWWITQCIQRLRHRRQRNGGQIPLHDRQRSTNIELCARNSRHQKRQPFDQPHARRTVHAFEIKLRARQSIIRQRHIQLGKRRMIELLVLAPRCTHRRLAPLGEAIILIEPVRLQNAERHVTSGATELLGRGHVDKARRHW